MPALQVFGRTAAGRATRHGAAMFRQTRHCPEPVEDAQPTPPAVAQGLRRCSLCTWLVANPELSAVVSIARFRLAAVELAVATVKLNHGPAVFRSF